MSSEDCDALDRGDNDGVKSDKMFTLKKWNAVAMWSWDVECDTCAICRVQVMGNGEVQNILCMSNKSWDGVGYILLSAIKSNIKNKHLHENHYPRFDLTSSDACLRCQGESKKDSYGKQDCVVVWGECNHSFHFCCMSLWVKQNNRCPLCQQEWSIQRMGK